MSNQNQFILNYADNAGGAIKWDEVEPNFEDNTTFSKNNAGLYGNNIASFA